MSFVVLKALMAKGVSAEDAVELLGVIEQEFSRGAPAVDDQAERRRASDRERKRRVRGMSAELSADVSADTPSLKEIPPTPPKENNPPPTPVRPLTRTNVPAASPKAFEEFWLAYPRKVGKGAARKAFAKALGKIRTDDPLATIMAALNTAKRAWGETEAQFIPHAATWLNQDRWEDDPLNQSTGPPPAAPLKALSADYLAERRALLEQSA